MTEKRDTVGALSSDLLIKANVPDHSAVEQMREQLDKYDENLIECVEKHKKDYTGDFYVVVVTKKERLMENVLRNYFFARHTCPTPEYDQTVYKYDRTNDALDFMWVIPSKQTCEYMRYNALHIPQSERTLLRFVMEFYDDTLMLLAKKLNGEQINTILLSN